MLKTKLTDKGISHYSDKNLKIKQIETGLIYDIADDILPCIYTYEETDQEIKEVLIDDNSTIE